MGCEQMLRLRTLIHSHRHGVHPGSARTLCLSANDSARTLCLYLAGPEQLCGSCSLVLDSVLSSTPRNHRMYPASKDRNNSEMAGFLNDAPWIFRRIPAGSVSTYGDMAKHLGSHARAVGQALRHNPFAPEVPCHRVISADRKLGGFCGEWGDASSQVQRKRSLLVGEGVRFVSEGEISKESIFDLSILLGNNASNASLVVSNTSKTASQTVLSDALDLRSFEFKPRRSKVRKI